MIILSLLNQLTISFSTNKIQSYKFRLELYLNLHKLPSPCKSFHSSSIHQRDENITTTIQQDSLPTFSHSIKQVLHMENLIFSIHKNFVISKSNQVKVVIKTLNDTKFIQQKETLTVVLIRFNTHVSCSTTPF